MAAEQTLSASLAESAARRRRWPQEMSILLVLLGVALLFEVLGWFVQGQSFLANVNRLQIMILQVAVIGIIAVGVTQVIITGGIDLSSGSVVAMRSSIPRWSTCRGSCRCWSAWPSARSRASSTAR
jgi:ribose/xylose/arabinose/galactoside ABC-type transport system permease subunit